MTELVIKWNSSGFLITCKWQWFKSLYYIMDYIIALSIVEEITVNNLRATE